MGARGVPGARGERGQEREVRPSQEGGEREESVVAVSERREVRGERGEVLEERRGKRDEVRGGYREIELVCRARERKRACLRVMCPNIQICIMLTYTLVPVMRELGEARRCWIEMEEEEKW